MASRFYIVPRIGTGTGTTPATHFRPKYIGDLGVLYAAMDYGLEGTYLVGAEVTPAQHTALAAEADVIAIPLNLDNAIGGALSQVESALETLNVPAGWVTTTHTYRQVIGAVGRLFRFMRTFAARQRRVFFESGVTLNLQMNDLTAAQRNALAEAATFLGLDISGITGTTTIRQALKILIDQMGPFTLFREAF